MITVREYHAMPEGLRKGARVVDPANGIQGEAGRSVETQREPEVNYLVSVDGIMRGYEGGEKVIDLGNLDDRMQHIGEAAINAFLLTMAQGFPDARTCEANPVTMFVFEQTAQSVLHQWVTANVPVAEGSNMPPAPLDPYKVAKAQAEAAWIRSKFEDEPDERPVVKHEVGDTVALNHDYPHAFEDSKGKWHVIRKGAEAFITEVDEGTGSAVIQFTLWLPEYVGRRFLLNELDPVRKGVKVGDTVRPAAWDGTDAPLTVGDTAELTEYHFAKVYDSTNEYPLDAGLQGVVIGIKDGEASLLFEDLEDCPFVPLTKLKRVNPDDM